ncbi:MAG TPA: glycosyl transferase family 1, partial [Actinoplanes sp.]|nr:glycosyl transferase family 1 [Actinoplanes sp.]
QAVLNDPQRYRAAYDKPGLLDSWTWEAQANVLNSVYRELLEENGASGSAAVAPRPEQPGRH